MSADLCVPLVPETKQGQGCFLRVCCLPPLQWETPLLAVQNQGASLSGGFARVSSLGGRGTVWLLNKIWGEVFWKHCLWKSSQTIPGVLCNYEEDGMVSCDFCAPHMGGEVEAVGQGVLLEGSWLCSFGSIRSGIGNSGFLFALLSAGWISCV